MDFQGGAQSRALQAAVVIYARFGTLKTFQTLTADLQPATSGQMIAEKQPTSGLLPEKKQMRIQSPQPGGTPQRGAGGYQLMLKT